MQIGVDSFVAATVDAAGRALDPARHLSELLEAITLADEVGLDVFGIGEHHRREFLDSAPTVILAAAAARTRRIRLTSAVTVLSAADPVRVFQEFATLDLLSSGRAEIVAGRGTHRAGSLPAGAPKSAAGLARCRRHAGLLYSRRHARVTAHGCDHRRRTAPLSTID